MRDGARIVRVTRRGPNPLSGRSREYGDRKAARTSRGSRRESTRAARGAICAARGAICAAERLRASTRRVHAILDSANEPADGDGLGERASRCEPRRPHICTKRQTQWLPDGWTRAATGVGARRERGGREGERGGRAPQRRPVAPADGAAEVPKVATLHNRDYRVLHREARYAERREPWRDPPGGVSTAVRRAESRPLGRRRHSFRSLPWSPTLSALGPAQVGSAALAVHRRPPPPTGCPPPSTATTSGARGTAATKASRAGSRGGTRRSAGADRPCGGRARRGSRRAGWWTPAV